MLMLVFIYIHTIGGHLATMMGRFTLIVQENRIQTYDAHKLVDQVSVKPASDFKLHKFTPKRNHGNALLHSVEATICYEIKLTDAGALRKREFACNMDGLRALLAFNAILIGQIHNTIMFYDQERFLMLQSQAVASDEVLLAATQLDRDYIIVTSRAMYSLDGSTLFMVRILNFHDTHTKAITFYCGEQAFLALASSRANELTFHRYTGNLQFVEYTSLQYDGVLLHIDEDYVITFYANRLEFHKISNIIKHKTDDAFSLTLHPGEKFVGVHERTKGRTLVLATETRQFGAGVYVLEMEADESSKSGDSEDWWNLGRKFLLPAIVSLALAVWAGHSLYKRKRKNGGAADKFRQFLRKKR